MKWLRVSAFLFAAYVVAMLIGCASIPPALQNWATDKAIRVAVCMADKAISERRAALECLGPFADDRQTYACERANAYLATLPEVP